MKLTRILVPTDLSEPSLRALDYAIAFAKPFGAEVVVLFVVEPIVYATPSDIYGASADLSMVLREQERSGRDQLKRLEQRYRRRVAKLRTVLQTGTPYAAITGAAKKLKADMIIMSTHGRTGLSHLFLGSVAEKVVRTAECPVLTVQATGAGKRGGQRRRRKKS
jgi:universal stress protein A